MSDTNTFSTANESQLKDLEAKGKFLSVVLVLHWLWGMYTDNVSEKFQKELQERRPDLENVAPDWYWEYGADITLVLEVLFYYAIISAIFALIHNVRVIQSKLGLSSPVAPTTNHDSQSDSTPSTFSAGSDPATSQSDAESGSTSKTLLILGLAGAIIYALYMSQKNSGMN